MRTRSLLAATLLFAYTAVAVEVELYPDSENCTGKKIVLTSTGCQDVEIRGSAKVISGGTWAYSGKGCSSLQTGVFTSEQGCFTTYPVYFSWYPLNR